MRDTKRANDDECARAGLFLRRRRAEVGVAQLEVAKAIGIDYPTMISQREAGKARVPPARYADYARALKMDPADFCKEILRAYDPEMWRILFGTRTWHLSPAPSTR
jgi:transcriptional regulator with XRE-family HTH domain